MTIGFMSQDTSTPKEEILHIIKKNPGIHLRRIKDCLPYSMGTIQYHLNRLEKFGKISSSKEFYKNYYPKNIGQEESKLMSVLNLEPQRKIVIYLLENEPSAHNELAKVVGLSPSTVSWHVKQLVELNVINLRYDGKYSLYSLNDKELVISVLKMYSESTWNGMLDSMAEMFDAFQK